MHVVNQGMVGKGGKVEFVEIIINDAIRNQMALGTTLDLLFFAFFIPIFFVVGWMMGICVAVSAGTHQVP